MAAHPTAYTTSRPTSPPTRFLTGQRLVLALVFCLLLLPGTALAQYTFPRLGFSASADAWVDSVAIDMDEPFTLHVNMYGYEPGIPIGQEFSAISWVVLSVCCGATLNVLDVQYSPEFEHTGGPYVGVVSTPNVGCVDEPMLHFATMTVTLDAPQEGEFLMVAGPYLNAADCDGGSPLVMDLPIRIIVGAGTTPNDQRSWGALKSLYR